MSYSLNQNQEISILDSEHTNQAGFGFTLLAMAIAIVMGLTVSMFFRKVSTQSEQWINLYTASQAKWASLSGIEYGLFKAELGEADVSGTYDFYNSTIVIDTTESFSDGGSLPDFLYMITSRGTSGDAIRDYRVLSKKSLRAIWGDVSIIEGTGDIQINASVTMDDSLYIGQDVEVLGGTIGATVHTHIYTPPGTAVDPTSGTNYTSGLHPREWLFSPDFNTDPYDSLIAIAAAITSTSGNKIKGNKTFKNVTIDLNSYADSTLYVSRTLKLRGCTVTGGDTTRPAVLVSAKDILANERNGDETTFSDNVVLIAGDDITLADATAFGADWSGELPEDRPSTFNMMYGFDYILIQEDAVAWSSTFSTDDIRLNGTSYGIVYAPDKFTIRNTAAYLEGAIFAKKFVGSNTNKINRGTMNLNHYFNQDFFKTFDFGVIDNSLLEY